MNLEMDYQEPLSSPAIRVFAFSGIYTRGKTSAGLS